MRDGGRITRPSHVLLQRGWESSETMPNSGLVSTPLSHSCSSHSCRTQDQTRSSTVWYNTEQALGLIGGSAFYAWLNSYFTPPYWDHYFLILLVYYSDVKVQFSCSVISDSLRPHGLQHARPPCPLLTPGAYSNSCPLSWWCHPTISSSVIPFSSHLQSFPASGSFPMSQFFASGGKSIGVSASASVLPTNIQDWFASGWTGLISLLSKGLSRVFFNTTVQKHQFFRAQLSLQSYSHIHTWLLEKP